MIKKDKHPAENRAYTFDIRSEKRDDGKSTLAGSPIVYGQRADIGGWFEEVIEPGALDGANLRDVPLLVNHEQKMIPIARSRNNNPNSTMRLMAVETGLNFEADIDTARNQTARELDSAIDRGDVDSMSFRFTVADERWERLETDYPLRHILRFDSILEISAVTWPAYSQTSIYTRDCKEALDNARAALESARQQDGSTLDSVESKAKCDAEELELLKEKTKLLGGF